MTDKELRKLSRFELVDIIYELQKQEIENKKLLEELREKLDEKELKLSNSGSIAQAALEVNNVFETAQNAADQYLLSVKAQNKEAEDAKKAVEEAKLEAEKIVAEAEAERDRILQNAQEEFEKRLSDFRENLDYIIKAHGGLDELLKE